jgi:hypothetical protein
MIQYRVFLLPCLSQAHCSRETNKYIGAKYDKKIRSAEFHFCLIVFVHFSLLKNLLHIYSHFPFAHPMLQLVLFDPPDLRDPGEGLLALLPPSGLPHVQILQ